MSNDKSPDLAAVPAETETSTKLSPLAKTKQFVKAHKKSTIAVGAFVSLVGLAAITGKKTATVTVQSPVEIDVEIDNESDDQSA